MENIIDIELKRYEDITEIEEYNQIFKMIIFNAKDCFSFIIFYYI